MSIGGGGTGAACSGAGSAAGWAVRPAFLGDGLGRALETGVGRADLGRAGLMMADEAGTLRQMARIASAEVEFGVAMRAQWY